jgi:hypothetical protein
MAIKHELGITADRLFEVEVFDATEELIAGQPVFLLELRAVAVQSYSAKPQLDPVLIPPAVLQSLRAWLTCCPCYQHAREQGQQSIERSRAGQPSKVENASNKS